MIKKRFRKEKTPIELTSLNQTGLDNPDIFFGPVRWCTGGWFSCNTGGNKIPFSPW